MCQKLIKKNETKNQMSMPYYLFYITAHNFTRYKNILQN